MRLDIFSFVKMPFLFLYEPCFELYTFPYYGVDSFFPFFVFFFFVLSGFESMFINAGDSETRKGPGQKKHQERGQAGLLWLTEKSEKKGPWRQVRGQALTRCCRPLLPSLQV